MIRLKLCWWWLQFRVFRALEGAVHRFCPKWEPMEKILAHEVRKRISLPFSIEFEYSMTYYVKVYMVPDGAWQEIDDKIFDIQETVFSNRIVCIIPMTVDIEQTKKHYPDKYIEGGQR